ncbi:MAG TPA: cytochrome c3 family protein [Kofleriaceae bacterium]|nr:cytochrome c3 family protein [Kofleriaceae bacterium]
MRRPILLAGLLGGVAGSALLGAQPAATTESDLPRATGFDHIGHEGQVVVAGAAEIPCGRCHQLRADGTLGGLPGHTSCFGECHGPPPPTRSGRKPYALDLERQRVCQACHEPRAMHRVAAGSAERLRAVYPPFAIEPDHSITFSHAQHTVPARAASGCRTCHAMPAEAGAPSPARPRPHTRCASCHDGTAVPAMTECRTCHLPAFGPSTSPHQIVGMFPVAGTFSHRAHLPRVSGSGDPCEACHADAAAAAGDQIPTPRTEACAGCHDGKAAFSTLEQSCRRCHERPAERTRRKASALQSFSHQAHEARGLRAPCDTCHRGASGVRAPVNTGHAPCSDAGCHREEFSSTTPRVCASCHVGNEPWRALHVEIRTTAETEFGARFDHRAHLAGESPPVAAPCGQCHRSDPRTGRLQLPRDHSTCGTAGCHADTAAPLMTACEQCHDQGAITRRRKSREAGRWSVRRRFDHAPHRTEPGDGATAVACQSCHLAHESRSLDDMPSPAKSSCVRCHDGQIAFKVTGHGCQRCHD